MRVALVCDEFYPDLGGIAHYGYELARELVLRGVDLTVVTHLHAGQPENEEVFGIRIKRIKGRVSASANRAVSPFIFHRCHSYLATQGFDLIHGLTIYSPMALMAVQFAQRKGIPNVLTCHSIIEPRYQILLHLPLVPIVRRADRVIAVSEATAHFCRRLIGPSDRIVAVLNGVDTAAFRLGIDGKELRDRLGLDSQPVVVTALRLAKRKGPHQLVAAFGKVLKSIPDAHLLIAGAGQEEKSLTRQISRMGIADSVHMVGRLTKEQVARLMATGDVFVLPSKLEAFGLAALEAAAAGTPVVCSNAGGIPEVFHDGVNALLYTPGDENQMADSMVRLIKDKELRAALSRNGVSTAQALTWAASAERTLTIYEEACRDNAARRVHR